MINKIFFDEQLDEVSAGQANWKNILADFWPGFHESVLGAMKIPVEKVILKSFITCNFLAWYGLSPEMTLVFLYANSKC